MREIRTHVGTPSSVATLVSGSSGDMPISSSALMKKVARGLAEISPWKTSITTASPSVRFTKERKTSPPFPTFGQELVTSTCNRLTSARLPVIGSNGSDHFLFPNTCVSGSIHSPLQDPHDPVWFLYK